MMPMPLVLFFMSPFKNSAILVVDGFGTSVVEKNEDLHYFFHLNKFVYYLREAQSIYLGEENKIKVGDGIRLMEN